MISASRPKSIVAVTLCGALWALACQTPAPNRSDDDAAEIEADRSSRPAAPDWRELSEKPVFTPYTTKPEILDPVEALAVVEHHYQAALKRTSAGGSVLLWVLIDAEGTVRNATVERSSGDKVLDEAALAAVREFRFSPGRNYGKAVPVWVAIPITFAEKT